MWELYNLQFKIINAHIYDTIAPCLHYTLKCMHIYVYRVSTHSITVVWYDWYHYAHVGKGAHFSPLWVVRCTLFWIEIPYYPMFIGIKIHRLDNIIACVCVPICVICIRFTLLNTNIQWKILLHGFQSKHNNNKGVRYW